MKVRRLAQLLAAALAVGLVAGCGQLNPHRGQPTVVASFYPLQYVAQRIVGDHATVLNLTHPGMEPHDLELTVQQTAEVVDAEVVFYESGFQASVDQVVAHNGPVHVVDATKAVRIVDDNPHFWLDPKKLEAVAQRFTDEVVRADPAHEQAYRKGFAGLASDLDRLDAAYTRGLRTCAIRTTVVSHAAFGELARYGLHVVAVNGLSPDAEPSPAHLKTLQDLITSDGITTVFSETLASPELADTLARDLGIKTAVLDPIEGLGATTRHEDYLSLMRQNLAALEKANRCT